MTIPIYTLTINIYIIIVLAAKLEYISPKANVVICPFFKIGSILHVEDLIGTWVTVYTQPKNIACFTLDIRAVTDLEREQYSVKYGHFKGRVDWNQCLLEVASPLGKHYLQGNGSESGLLENVIITETETGRFVLQNQSADQWRIFGRRGSEILVMRDCSGGAFAALARAAYWPTTSELYSVLHRSGLAPTTQDRVLCEPQHYIKNHSIHNNGQ